MSRATASPDRHTYLSDNLNLAEVMSFRDALQKRGRAAPEDKPRLVAADGTPTPMPQAVFDALTQIVDALSKGQGVSVVPMDAMLTTQQAADYLGISRPTLIKLLESGAISFELVGRHRRIRLRDLVEYQDDLRKKRRRALRDLSSEAVREGFFDPDADAPVKTR
ncbi:helix-turn-helix domain-containing protein [Arthrobacter sp. 35/47]|uniref:helix-turn-helix domain-containing protein n=1 Tax=Arthrobacter sp. 35/47 TaxID=269454 RepID=UPI00047B7C18|nr:helix-turn-helix domain-containing protein [Arthrobacter sp. 35/47]